MTSYLRRLDLHKTTGAYHVPVGKVSGGTAFGDNSRRTLLFSTRAVLCYGAQRQGAGMVRDGWCWQASGREVERTGAARLPQKMRGAPGATLSGVV